MLNKPLFWIPLCVSLLCACGGGDNQQISNVQLGTFAYGKAASIYLSGVDLRSSMQVETGLCVDPVFSSQSVPQLAVVTCMVTSVGDVPFVVKGSSGQVLLNTTANVPLPQVSLTTSLGKVVLELRPDVVPETVNNFLNYVNQGYYANTVFHRVIDGFVAQGGGFTTGMVAKAGQDAPITLQSNQGLSNVRGSLAMARTNLPDSATSQFYINLSDNLSLDYQNTASPGYAVFGAVVQGMDVVDLMATFPTTTVGGYADVPASDITILAATQTR
jgi:cyclophilin family peptidyl-prolyl cis-trans isomerase